MNTQTTTPAKKFIKTSEKIEINDYPYGFKLRCTMFDYIEFDAKKGYRHCTQTINPKNDRLNNPKKSTYYTLMLRYYNELGHIKTACFDFNGDESINKGIKFVNENFELFTVEELKYLYSVIYASALNDMRATAIYCGSDIEALKLIYTPFLEICKQALKQPETNFFNLLNLDTEAINKTKVPNFNPFKVREYTIG